MKSPAELVTDAMNEKPEETRARHALGRESREKFDKERDADLDEKSNGLKNISRRNDAWDMDDNSYL